MEFVCLGNDTTVDVLLSGSSSEQYDDLEALMDQVIETSPPFSEFSSGDSGMVSPDPFTEEDLFTTFLQRHGLEQGELARPVVTKVETTPITSPAFTTKSIKASSLNRPNQDLSTTALNGKVGSHKMAECDQMDKSKKNALAARLNRQKKKEYVHGLENKVGELTSENDTLRRRHEKMESEVLRLRNEVEYLKSVIANQSTLSNILENLPGITGVTLSPSMARKRSPTSQTSANQRQAKCPKMGAHSGGVCIHVGKGSKASLEFCSQCSLMSASS